MKMILNKLFKRHITTTCPYYTNMNISLYLSISCEFKISLSLTVFVAEQ